MVNIFLNFERDRRRCNRICNRAVLYCSHKRKEEVISGVQGRMWGNEYRTTVVCVDIYGCNEVKDRLYNPYLPDGQCFQSLMDFLRKMEELLDEMQFPQPFTASRGFREPPAPLAERPMDTEIREGKCGTFAVRIMFRQNASWQGSVSWLEGGREESFRSALELLQIMDSALSGENGTKKETQSCGA